MNMPPISDLRRWSEATGYAVKTNDPEFWEVYWKDATSCGVGIGRLAIDWISANPAPFNLKPEPIETLRALAPVNACERAFPSPQCDRVPDELIPARMACISADMRMGADWWKRRP
jgi:hypothetical protein